MQCAHRRGFVFLSAAQAAQAAAFAAEEGGEEEPDSPLKVCGARRCAEIEIEIELELGVLSGLGRGTESPLKVCQADIGAAVRTAAVL